MTRGEVSADGVTSAVIGEEAIGERHARAADIVRTAAATALRFFGERDTLAVESKGRQDWVSVADRGVEREIRDALAAAFPDDGVVGEEHDDVAGSSGFVWVIDPIDGTTNFVNGMPGWCVVLAGVHDGRTVLAHVTDPVAGEVFAARLGCGATLGGEAIAVAASGSLSSGTLGVGHSLRVPPERTLALLASLLDVGGLFYRSGSGALDLAKVAAGRLIGYAEAHMNAWDCLAALLLVEEAGGQVQPFDMEGMLARGGRVVASAPGVHDALVAMADAAYREPGRGALSDGRR